MSKTVVVVAVLVVAVAAFLGGLGVGNVLFSKAPPLPPLVIGTNTPFKPFEYRDASNKLVGFDVDLATEVALRMGFTAVWKDFQDWDAFLLAVQYGGVDMGASSITSSGDIGTQRNATFYFSAYYYIANQGVLAKASDTLACATSGCTPTDLGGIKVAVQRGTSSDFWVDDNLVTAGLTLETDVSKFNDVQSVLLALNQGSVRIVVIDKPVAESAVASNSQLKLAGTIITNEQYSFAFVRNAEGQALRDSANRALTAMKADGKFQEIWNKWFTA